MELIEKLIYLGFKMFPYYYMKMQKKVLLLFYFWNVQLKYQFLCIFGPMELAEKMNIKFCQLVFAGLVAVSV